MYSTTLSLIHRMSMTSIFCFGSIPILLFILYLYHKRGIIVASSLCFIFFFASLYFTGMEADSRSGFITTENQDRWTKTPSRGALNSGILLTGDCFEKMLFIPKSELFVGEDGFYMMKTTGKRPRKWEDYYILEETYSGINVPSEYGGWGIPTWVYNPGCSNWLFLLGGLPIMLAGAVVKKQIN
jgi:hypothetical protein